FFSSRRRHTRSKRDWSSDVCSSDLSACSQIGAGIAQNVDQLKRHAVALAQGQHLVLTQAREISNMPETEPRPEFTGTTSNQIGVFIQIGRDSERANFFRIVKAL